MRDGMVGMLDVRLFKTRFQSIIFGDLGQGPGPPPTPPPPPLPLFISKKLEADADAVGPWTLFHSPG